MKKKKTFKSVLALMLALTMVIAGNMTVFAADDGCYRPENPNNDYVGGTTIGGDDGGSGSSGSGSSSSDSSSSSSSSSSESSGSSSGGGSYDAGSSYDGGGSYDAGSGSNGSGSTYSAPAPKVAGSKATAGKQEFRAVANAANGTYKVIHCGSERMTFSLKNADGKAAACDDVALKQLDNKKWAIDFKVADAKGMTIGAPLDRTYMYDTLGVSYVTINDEVVIDIEAESAAKAAK